MMPVVPVVPVMPVIPESRGKQRRSFRILCFRIRTPVQLHAFVFRQFVNMFRRADWVHSKKGRGGGLEDSSSSDSEDDEGSLRSSQESEDDDSEDDSGEEQLDSEDEENEDDQDGDNADDDEDEDGSLLDTMAEELGDGDDEMLSMCAMKKGDHWFEAGKAGKLLRGRPLTCVPCARKKKVLLLNSVMLYKHFTSAQHLKEVQGVAFRTDDGPIFRYADVQDRMGLVTGAETHQERLERVMAVDTAGAATSRKNKATQRKKNGKSPKAQRRKTRPGKRQRQEQKDARANESAATTTTNQQGQPSQQRQQRQ